MVKERVKEAHGKVLVVLLMGRCDGLRDWSRHFF